MVGPAELALRLSYDLEGISDRATYLSAVGESLAQLLVSDTLGWVGVHPATHETEIFDPYETIQPALVGNFTLALPRQPMYLSYTKHPESIAPRRLSDVIGAQAWKNHPVYEEPFVPLAAAHQLTIALHPLHNGVIHSWVFLRRATDFSDDDLALATALQPVLVTLNRLSELTLAPVAQNCSPYTAEAVRLTPREVEVLKLVSCGYTAVAIGHIQRISPHTVCKHLENIYNKLDCHGRLRAVQEAIRLGIIELPE